MRRTVLCALVGLVLCCGAPPAVGGDLEPKEQKSRLRKLKSRAGEYLKARKVLVRRCKACNGAGQRVLIKSGTGGRVARTVACEPCRGHGYEISSKSYLQLEYHLKSSAFRLQPDKYKRVQRALDSAKSQGPPPRITRTSLKTVALHGDDHGIAWIKENREKEYRPLQWIWGVEPGESKGDWFVYDEKADGPWPTAEEVAEVVVEEPGAPDPFDVRDSAELEPAEREKLDAATKPLRIISEVLDARRKDDVFLLFLEVGTGGQSRGATQTVVGDSTALLRTVFHTFPNLDGTHLHFTATFKDKFGALSKRPLVIVWSDHRTLAKIVWENLEPDEVFNLFHVDWKEHTGYTLVQ